MKKKLSYRDKLLELSYIYNVKEIQEYVKRKKNLTTGQIELILKKNNIIIPKDFQSSFFKENFSKPISKLKTNIIDYKEEKIKEKNKLLRRVENYKYDTSRRINHGINSLWRGVGIIGFNFLNILPKLGTTVAKFFGDLFTDVFNSIYNQQIDQKSARKVIIGFFVLAGVTTTIVFGVNNVKDLNFFGKKIEIKKDEKETKKDVKKQNKVSQKETKKIEPLKKESKKPELKQKKNNK